MRFNSEGLDLFLEWHGRGDYPASALNPILMSYAYENAGKTYPFLTILRELKTDAVVENGTTAASVPIGTTSVVPAPTEKPAPEPVPAAPGE